MSIAFTPAFSLLGQAGCSSGLQELISDREPGRPSLCHESVFTSTFSLSSFSGPQDTLYSATGNKAALPYGLFILATPGGAENQVIYQHIFRVKLFFTVFLVMLTESSTC